MIKTHFGFAVVLVVVVYACHKQPEECLVCGKFKIANFSKEAENTTTNNSVRRSLNLVDSGGTDHYILWSWDKKDPENSWSGSVTKSVELINSFVEINENGSWQIEMDYRENFSREEDEENCYFSIAEQFSESGNWYYRNGQDKYVVFEKKKQVCERHIIKAERENLSSIIEDYTEKDSSYFNPQKHSRTFELKNEANGEIVLRTFGTNHFMQVEDTGGNCSVMEGNILMTLVENRFNSEVRRAALTLRD